MMGGMAVEAVRRLLAAVGGRRVGLVTNPTGWLGAAGHVIDILHDRGLLAALFAPEHGVWGDLQAGEHVAGGIDPRTGVPVHSLYGPERLAPETMLDGVDVVVGCLQDAGARPYTYHLTLVECLRAAAAVGVPFVLLDRPTPLGGMVCQGNVAAGRFAAVPLPMRPALSYAEQLRLVIAAERLDVEFAAMPLLEAPRERWCDELPVCWVAPSPNLPTVTSALLFTATVLLEATNVSEGRGTTQPFEIFGAPWYEPHRLAEAINRRGLPGLLARPTWFRPTFSKHQGERCGGVQLHVTDRTAFDGPRVGLHLLDVLRRLAPERYEVRAGYLDALTHDPAIGRGLETGLAPDDLAAEWPAQLASYREACAAVGVGPPEWAG